MLLDCCWEGRNNNNKHYWITDLYLLVLLPTVSRPASRYRAKAYLYLFYFTFIAIKQDDTMLPRSITVTVNSPMIHKENKQNFTLLLVQKLSGEGLRCSFATPNPFVLTNKICLNQGKEQFLCIISTKGNI